jgi:hypothetical protein
VSAVNGKTIYDWVPFETKQEILNSLEVDFAKECSFVFDAAYVLNPAFYDTICSLARSTNELDQLEWDDLKNGTLDILKHLVRRDLGMRNTLTPEDEVKEFSRVQSEFQQYYLRVGFFECADAMDTKCSIPEIWWDSKAPMTALKRYAVILLSIAHSVSNVERNHKVTSSIHSDKRNRLRHTMVTALTRGHMVFRNERLAAKTAFRVCKGDFKKICEMTDDDEDLDR